nr:uncharacterized protein LOC119168750 [Rhipicephalus microplus]
MRPPYWKTKFYDDPADRQFALRMIGWINWTTTRCEEYSGWACGGRGIEASSLAISETAETAAQDYAMEYAVELIERARAMNTKEPDEDVKTETSDYDFNNMASVFQACRKGEKKKDDFAKKFTAAFDPAWNLKPTFRPDAEADSAISTLHDYHEKLNFFPLGDINVAKADDEEAKNTPTFTIFPARFVGRAVDTGYGPHDSVIQAGFKAISTILPKSCCGDDGAKITTFETTTMKALQVTDEKIIDVGGTETSKLGKGLPDICTEVYKQDQCRFLSVNSRSAFGVPLRGAAAATIMNWAMMKFVILFAPFLPSDDPSLLPFYQLVALFHRRAEMPHKDILCMHILERYYSDTLQWLINKDDYLNNVKAHMQQAVSKLDSQVSALGAKGQEDFFTMQLAYPKSPFPPEMIKRVPLKPFFADYSRMIYFAPETPEKSIKGVTTKMDPYSIIFARGEAVATAKYKGIQKKAQCWVGPVFSGEPFQDPLHDLMFLPVSLAMPPYYHNDTDSLKHSVPGYLSKIFKVMTERFVKLFVSSYKPSKRPYAREPESKPELKAAKYIDQPAEYMLKQVKCFSKAYGTDRMWDLFYEKSGVQLAYQVWRLLYNHVTVNKDMQLRLAYIKFFSEEMIFFVTAANGHCYAANPRLASKKELELAPKRVNSLLQSKLLGQSMLCAPERELYKPVCGGLFAELQRVDEALWTVESWRQAKKVLSD